MSEANLAVVAEIGERLCVLFLFTCKVLGQMDSSSLSTKVILKCRIRTGMERGLTHVQTHAVFLDFHVLAMGLRLLLDPWRRGPVPLHPSTEVSGSNYCTDKVRLVRKEILESVHLLA